MKIGDLNLWPCVWFKESKTFSKDDFLSSTAEFFVFGDNSDSSFLLANRSDVADAFLRLGVDAYDPEEVLTPRPYLILYAQENLSSIPYIGNQEKFGLVLNNNQEPSSVLMDIQNIYELHYEMRMGIYHRDLNVEFYKRIVDNMEEEVFVTDEYGFVQFLNPYAEKVCGVKMSDIVGWHVDDMEKNGIISSSITKEVFRYKKTCNRMMDLHTGQTVMATGIPLYAKNGSLANVLATSKNIADLRNVLTHLQDLTEELDEKETEIRKLQEKVITQENYVLESPSMRRVEKDIQKVAATDATVLVEGESGAGKEVVADLIFKLSDRHDKPFVKINCAMIPEHLLESEFFGYEAGAFTGASRSGKKGKFEMADGGTLFLDEIGEMPLSLQAKILEVLQDREIVRVGGVKRIPVNVRIVAATNRDLKQMVRDGQFRGDLYYRLNVMTIFVEPLRHRTEDIIPLSALFLHKYNARFGKSKVFAPSVVTYFLHYEWPGNVREMMHLIERLVIVSDADVISVSDVNRALYDDEKDTRAEEVENGISSLKLAKQQLELSMVKKAYETYRSSYKVAEVLGVSQPAVMKILKRNGFCLRNGNLIRIEN